MAFHDQKDSKSTGSKPSSAIATLLEPKNLLASLEIKLLSKETLDQYKTLAEKASKYIPPFVPPPTINDSIEAIYFYGVESEERATYVLKELSDRLTSREIAVLMRIISDEKQSISFLEKFKSQLSLDQLSMIAEYQLPVARNILDDEKIPLKTKHLANIAWAHAKKLVAHPRVASEVENFNLEQLARIYKEIPNILDRKLKDLFSQLGKSGKNAANILKSLSYFAEIREVAERIIQHPEFKKCKESKDSNIKTSTFLLITTIGFFHPDLCEEDFSKLDIPAKKLLTVHTNLAKKIVDDPASPPQILYEVALHHPLSLGLSVLQREDFLLFSSKEEIFKLACAHEYLAEIILETKISREKLNEKQLWELAHNNHRLKMKLLKFQLVKEFPMNELDFKMANDLIKKNDPDLFTQEQFECIATMFPFLFYDIFRNPVFEAKCKQFTSAAQCRIAQWNKWYGDGLFDGSIKFNGEPSDKDIVDILLNDENKTLKLLDDAKHPWYSKLFYIEELCLRFKSVAKKVLTDAKYANFLEFPKDSQIINIAKKHPDIILQYKDSFLKHSAQKSHLRSQVLEVCAERKSSPSPVKQVDDKKIQYKITDPIKLMNAFSLIDDRIQAIIDENKPLSPLDPGHLKERILHPHRSNVFDQSTLLSRKSDVFSGYAGFCSGFEMDFARYRQKHKNHPAKSFATKHIKISNPSFSLIENSNLQDRISYFHYKQNDYIDKKLWQKEFFGGMNESDLRSVILLAYQLLSTYPNLVLRFARHKISVFQSDSEPNLFLVKDSNKGIVSLSFSDAIHYVTNTILTTQRDSYLLVEIEDLKPIETPKALKQPKHRKSKHKAQASIVPPTHPMVTHLDQLKQCEILELKYQSTSDLAFLVQAGKIRITLPKQFDLYKRNNPYTIEDKYEESPLLNALNKKDYESADFLLTHFFDDYKPAEIFKAFTPFVPSQVSLIAKHFKKIKSLEKGEGFLENLVPNNFSILLSYYLYEHGELKKPISLEVVNDFVNFPTFFPYANFRNNKSAMDLAIQYENWDVVKVLIENRAFPFNQLQRLFDSLLEKNQFQLAKILRMQQRITQPNPNYKLPNGKYLIHELIQDEKLDLDFIKNLCEVEPIADLKLTTPDNKDVLTLTEEQKHPEEVSKYLQRRMVQVVIYKPGMEKPETYFLSDVLNKPELALIGDSYYQNNHVFVSQKALGSSRPNPLQLIDIAIGIQQWDQVKNILQKNLFPASDAKRICQTLFEKGRMDLVKLMRNNPDASRIPDPNYSYYTNRDGPIHVCLREKELDMDFLRNLCEVHPPADLSLRKNPGVLTLAIENNHTEAIEYLLFQKHNEDFKVIEDYVLSKAEDKNLGITQHVRQAYYYLRLQENYSATQVFSLVVNYLIKIMNKLEEPKGLYNFFNEINTEEKHIPLLIKNHSIIPTLNNWGGRMVPAEWIRFVNAFKQKMLTLATQKPEQFQDENLKQQIATILGQPTRYGFNSSKKSPEAEQFNKLLDQSLSPEASALSHDNKK